MLESLKLVAAPAGLSRPPGVNIDRLIEVLMRISYLAADYPEILELDVNPLLATPKNASRSTRASLSIATLTGKQIEPYSHLALRPYPEEYVRPAVLRTAPR